MFWELRTEHGAEKEMLQKTVQHLTAGREQGVVVQFLCDRWGESKGWSCSSSVTAGREQGAVVQFLCDRAYGGCSPTGSSPPFVLAGRTGNLLSWLSAAQHLKVLRNLM